MRWCKFNKDISFLFILHHLFWSQSQTVPVLDKIFQLLLLWTKCVTWLHTPACYLIIMYTCQEFPAFWHFCRRRERLPHAGSWTRIWRRPPTLPNYWCGLWRILLGSENDTTCYKIKIHQTDIYQHLFTLIMLSDHSKTLPKSHASLLLLCLGHCEISKRQPQNMMSCSNSEGANGGFV